MLEQSVGKILTLHIPEAVQDYGLNASGQKIKWKLNVIAICITLSWKLRDTVLDFR